MVIHQALVGFQPPRAFEFITHFLRIPRPSRGEIQAVRLIEGWAMCHGWRTHIDKAGNISVHVPATPGFEKARAICIQAHLDMVYVPQLADLIQQPIDIEVVNGMLRSKGQTRTLGMDNIAGVAKAMYLAESAKVHGPIELLFTVDEEDNFSGVEGWDPLEHGMVARLLMNLDTPLFRKVAVRSGGVQYVLATLATLRESVSGGAYYKLDLAGYLGGHNADHAHLSRGNAIKDMGNILALLPVGWRLVEVSGGDAGNSIPSVATAVVWIPSDSGWKEPLCSHIDDICDAIRNDGITLTIDECSTERLPMNEAATTNLVTLLQAVPSHVVKMSEFSPNDAAALSTTFSVLSTDEDGTLRFKSIARGSDETAMLELATTVKQTYEQYGCTTEFGHFMNSWVQEPGSSLVQSALAAFASFGIPAELREFHCALELRCLTEAKGVVRFDEAVSIGSQVNNEHATTEEMDLGSFRMTILVAEQILADVAHGVVATIAA